jgi:hypothetical protein
MLPLSIIPWNNGGLFRSDPEPLRLNGTVWFAALVKVADPSINKSETTVKHDLIEILVIWRILPSMHR